MELSELLATPVENMFQGFFLPLVLIFAIVWGILSSIRVFDRKVNIILSLALSLMVFFTPQFTLLSTYMAQLGGQIAIIAFGLVFGFGVLMWAFGRGRDIYYEQAATDKRIMRLEDKIRKAREKGRLDTAEDLEKERRQLLHELERRR
jgi:hypothetical protein